MSDELETILAESLRTRAAHADTHGRGFGEVRRRVRRHRQRQMAAGLLPAVAGFGWIVTRPVADDPLRPGADTTGCGDPIPASTWPAWTGEATTLPLDASGPYVTDVNGNEVYVGTTTTYPFSTLAPTTTEVAGNGNQINTAPPSTEPSGSTSTTGLFDGNGDPVGVGTTVAVDANGNVITTPYDAERDGSTTTIDDRLLTSSTVVGEVTTTTDCPTDTGPTATVAPSFLRVLVVNASSVGGANVTTIDTFFPRAASANATVEREETFVLLMNPDAANVAQYVADSVGVDVKSIDRALVADEIGLVGVDLSEYDVVLVIGNAFATSFGGSPSTTALADLPEPTSLDTTTTSLA